MENATAARDHTARCTSWMTGRAGASKAPARPVVHTERIGELSP
jgi:hypothetical protein